MSERKINRTRQHEPLRIPEGWHGQDRAFVVQLNRMLDEIYSLIGRLEMQVREIREDMENAVHGESEP
jgi:hypothetical protein